MRLRYVKNARELIEKHPEYIIDKQDKEPIHMNKLFPNNNPIHVEIGMGKGKFIYELASNNPKINYIGIEKFDSAIVKALEKVIETPLANLYLLRTDANILTELFPQNSIDRIYLNFSDPWPKERHAKRRLTHKDFLKRYQEVLKPKKEIHLKTDNLAFFRYSVESILDFPMDINFLTYDLHKQEDISNIMTEFEEKFSKKGIKINKLVATFKEDTNG